MRACRPAAAALASAAAWRRLPRASSGPPPSPLPPPPPKRCPELALLCHSLVDVIWVSPVTPLDRARCTPPALAASPLPLPLPPLLLLSPPAAFAPPPPAASEVRKARSKCTMLPSSPVSGARNQKKKVQADFSRAWAERQGGGASPAATGSRTRCRPPALHPRPPHLFRTMCATISAKSAHSKRR